MIPAKDARPYDNWADYYDLAEADRSVMTSFYAGLVTGAVRSILELACGTGVILSALSKRVAELNGTIKDARFAGLDESKRMLEIARRREPQFEWVLGDIREPPIEGHFDLVICCFNTLQFCRSDAELLRTFKAVRQLLSKEGVFAFDLYQPSLQYLSVPLRNRLIRQVQDAMGRTFELLEDASYDASTGQYDVTWRLKDPNSGMEAPARLNFRYNQYPAADVEHLLNKAGFAIRERYGNLDKSPFTELSKKQVVVCGFS